MPKGLTFTKWHGCGNDFVFFIDMKDELADKYDVDRWLYSSVTVTSV